MQKIYELGKSLNLKRELKIDKNLRFTHFPYSGIDIITTSALSFIFFLGLGLFAEFIFQAEILFATAIFFGLMISAILYIYPTQIYYHIKIMEYNKELLNSIMRFSTYLSMKANLEYALKNSIEHTKGILAVQFKDILIKLERKEYIDIGEAFKDYSLIWNKFSPEFVDALKLLEIASLSSGNEAEKIMEESVSQILLSYNIKQKRTSEELSEKISKVITIGVMLPVMFLMLVPLVSIFLPDVIKAGFLFLIFNVLIPTFLFVSALNFSAKRLQLSNIDISTAKEHKSIPAYMYVLAVIIFFIFAIPSFIYLIFNNPSSISFESFGFETIFFVWLIPTGVTLAILLLSSYYTSKNKKLWNQFREIEEDIPHLLNYFSTYLMLNVPLENVFKEVSNDYSRHGFKNHPTVKLMEQISFKLNHLKTTLLHFIKYDLKEISSVKSLNEILEQITSFGEFSLKEAAKVSKKIRSERIGILKLNDYILTLLNSTIGLINSTITLLAPLLSALAIVMSLFVVTFIQYLTQQLESIANIGGSGNIEVQLIDIDDVISPVYLQLIIGFYIVQILIILAFMKSTIKTGYNSYSIVEAIRDSQIGFLIFTFCLFGGFWIFRVLFSGILNIQF